MSKYINYEFYKMTLTALENHLAMIQEEGIPNYDVDTYQDGLAFAVNQMRSLEDFVIEGDESIVLTREEDEQSET